MQAAEYLAEHPELQRSMSDPLYQRALHCGLDIHVSPAHSRAGETSHFRATAPFDAERHIHHPPPPRGEKSRTAEETAAFSLAL